MTFIVERLAELRKHLAHLRELRPRVQLDPVARFAEVVGQIARERG